MRRRGCLELCFEVALYSMGESINGMQIHKNGLQMFLIENFQNKNPRQRQTNAAQFYFNYRRHDHSDDGDVDDDDDEDNIQSMKSRGGKCGKSEKGGSFSCISKFLLELPRFDDCD